MEPKATILVAEDSRFLRTATASSLRREGFHVLEAMNGDEALRLAQVSLPDLILLDYVLPGLDGREVLTVLKRDPRTMDIPVVVLSGSKHSAEDALTSGAHAFLAKQSTGLKQLLALVELVLTTREAHGERPMAVGM
jgi:CheY-like chemotaxis protein